MPATSSRMSSSSSTIRISDAMFNLFSLFPARRAGLRRWHHDADHGPPSAMEIRRRIVQFQMAAMVLDDLLDDRKAEPRALFPRRHIGLEQPLAVFTRQPLAVVDHVDRDRVACLRGADADRAPNGLAVALRALDRFGRVLDQVSEGL